MPDYWPGWLDYDDSVQLAIVRADYRRMQRTHAETESLYARLARQRVRFILNRLVNR
ncbi:MAG TPA: hypothetical protein VNU68_35465 [Verrucomicrobiae bacterium]|nr:hypothetical protein [Verrucomicrobiae bacterium]